MFSHVAWYPLSVRCSHLASSASGQKLHLSAFPLPRILLVLLPCLYLLPGYWPISTLLNKYEWQIFTVHKSIIPQQIYLELDYGSVNEVPAIQAWGHEFIFPNMHAQPSMAVCICNFSSGSLVVEVETDGEQVNQSLNFRLIEQPCLWINKWTNKYGEEW